MYLVVVGLFCGVLTGVLAGLFGIGGGVILVPLLVLLFNYPQHMAIGTSLTAMLLPVGILGVVEYYRGGKITGENLKFGLVIAVGIFLGTYLGSQLSLNLSDTLLRKCFAVFMLFVAVKLWLS